MANKKYIYFIDPELSEGGMSRNGAFHKVFSKSYDSTNVYSTSKIRRLVITLRIWSLLAFSQNKEFFVHQAALLYLFPVKLFKYRTFRSLYKWVMSRAAKQNKLTVEINDLPYEQSIDLGLEVKNEYHTFQKITFELPKSNFIFASRLMRKFAIEKYHVNAESSSVIINGAPEIADKDGPYFDFYEDSRLKFVYSGTLNKGRAIEDLIAIFENQLDKLLILLGPEGEWILQNKNTPPNVLYLGSFRETEAHQIVTKCDVGLIHYDEEKLYYNICFPTKASFYVVAGIAVLSTPAAEIYDEFKEQFLFANFSKWPDFIENLTMQQVQQSQKAVENVKFNYTWSNLLKKLR